MSSMVSSTSGLHRLFLDTETAEIYCFLIQEMVENVKAVDTVKCHACLLQALYLGGPGPGTAGKCIC